MRVQNSITGKYAEVGTDQEVWDDLVTPLVNAKIAGAGYPDFDTFNGALNVISFPPTTETTVYFTVQLPHKWKEGTNIKPHLHYLNDSTVEGTKVAKFTFGYQWYNNTGAITPLEVTDPKTTPVQDTAYFANMLGFTEISGAGKTISSLLVCRLTRNGTDPSDNFTGDIWGISFDFHIQYDKDGSRTATAV